MEPNSTTLLAMVLILAVGLLVVLWRTRRRWVALLVGLLALTLAASAGMAVVNDYFGYYQSWNQLSADVTGSYSAFAPAGAARTATVTGAGRLESLELPGRRSGIERRGLVYLPPQYFQRRYAHTRFPVLELVHGTPGAPSDWVVHLRVLSVMHRLLAEHLSGPVILVMPTMSAGTRFEECVNAPGALDDTYITRDVRADVVARFRASRAPAQWGIAGYSSGGYCAANLALRHRADFGAAGVMDGYFRPQDGPAAAALGNRPAAEAANDPIALASALPAGVAPLPAFWLSAGTGDAADFAGARAFAGALHGVEAVPLYREPNAGHNFYAWAASLPHLIGWMWGRLASPSLRVDFPISGHVRRSTIIAPRPRVPAHPAARPAARSAAGRAAGVVAGRHAGRQRLA